MTDRPTIIVVGYSARALASSAKRAGFAPLSVDVFGDEDMREMSLASVKLDGGLSDGLTIDKVDAAVALLTSAHDPIGLVYAGGFEHQPETVAAIARRTRIFGNGAETLKRAKDPLGFARMCAARGVQHPEVQLVPPDEPELWLRKTRGGAGGGHIVPADDAGPAAPQSYFQRRVAGRSVSALFLACPRKIEIIGLSMQWTAPTPTSPFLYGGAAGPIDIEPTQAGEITRSITAIASDLDLVGLNSADFLVSDDIVWLLEINPRPGATLDVFESNESPLLMRHVAACEGRLTPTPAPAAFRAAEIVYASHDLIVRVDCAWPDWAVDRSAPGTPIDAGDPLCTALASSATVDMARMRASERAKQIVALVQEPDA